MAFLFISLTGEQYNYTGQLLSRTPTFGIRMSLKSKGIWIVLSAIR
jgi:hypothetical protein